METGGIKHGVLGQKQFGYLEGTVNADAVALRVVDEKTSQNIYKQIEAFPAIRPFDFLLTNAPGLDDTYGGWGRTSGKGLDGFWKFGDWVNGGVWGTVEGRAILMYYRLGKFGDIRRSATRAMKWAKDFRMDAPWSQQGENTSNPWSDKGKFRVGGVAVMVDNFAIPAATIRGLFDYDYRSDRLILRPRIPGSITQYTQNEPVFFGKKKIFLSCSNGGPSIKSLTINGKTIHTASAEEIALLYNELPEVSNIEIVTEGGWPKESPAVAYPVIPTIMNEAESNTTIQPDLPESLKTPWTILTKMKNLLAEAGNAGSDQAFLEDAIHACEDCGNRIKLDTGLGYYRPITPERREGINKFYEQTALSMYTGFAKRMAAYAEKGDENQKHLAALFLEARK
jgi:hypothetical protein